jgi:hypothetical protein
METKRSIAICWLVIASWYTIAEAQDGNRENAAVNVSVPARLEEQPQREPPQDDAKQPIQLSSWSFQPVRPNSVHERSNFSNFQLLRQTPISPVSSPTTTTTTAHAPGTPRLDLLDEKLNTFNALSPRLPAGGRVQSSASLAPLLPISSISGNQRFSRLSDLEKLGLAINYSLPKTSLYATRDSSTIKQRKSHPKKSGEGSNAAAPVNSLVDKNR